MNAPQIRRVPLVRGRTVVLRDVAEADAAFILSLRLDPARNQFLSPVGADVAAQQAWIRGYREGTGQAYFVIESLQGEPLGTVRIYDAEGDSFSWGSWVLKPGAPTAAAMESALLVYRLALSWGFRAAHFKVYRANTSVVRFHESFGARRLGDEGEEVRMAIDREAIEASLRRYARFLPPEGAP